eukprot:TRINITY_DN103286_c0_g1_i1.p1 TRINITY_DN103286_c0_g1~~TRINITY_DN103286_c0_g1_i1.p1  ORF type:complete len:429 (-),score=157.42 TRINITY_DN103286_c0_g1_i1:193-1479(-)
MQARSLTRIAMRRGVARNLKSQAAVASGAQRHSSFIKQVMEQVKKDMESDEKLKKDWESAQKSSERLKKQSEQYGDRLGDLNEKMKSASAKTADLLGSWKEKASETKGRFSSASEDNETVKKAREFMKDRMGSSSESSAAVSKIKQAYSGVMDKSAEMLNMFSGEASKGTRLKDWKASNEAKADTMKATKAAQEAAEAGEATKEQEEAIKKAQEQVEGESALVVSKAYSSTWDRFGAGLRDSPFLSSVFENPLFDRVFGESEIAASIREMKQLDYSFTLEDFAEDIEYVVAPHIIQTYLEGDQDALKRHCGEAAFAAVDAGIKARIQQQLSLDANILSGPREVELKGAKLMEKGAPCFIWTFTMQQVNCLRDKHNEIIEGAVDDIRTVCYALAVTRHPDLDDEEADASALEYPWQVSELAILWNQPSF